MDILRKKFTDLRFYHLYYFQTPKLFLLKQAFGVTAPRWMVVMMGSNGALEASRTSSSMSSVTASPAHTARDPAAASAGAATLHHIKTTSSERMNNYMSEDDNLLDEPLFVNDPAINDRGRGGENSAGNGLEPQG